MDLLVDSHALVWASTGDDRLSPLARKVMSRERLWISAVTHWELAIKAQTRGLPASSSAAALVQEQVRAHGLRLLPLKFEHIAEFEELPLHHRDPFDRMLVAQARCENLTLLSADAVFLKYDVDVVW